MGGGNCKSHKPHPLPSPPLEGEGVCATKHLTEYHDTLGVFAHPASYVRMNSHLQQRGLSFSFQRGLIERFGHIREWCAE